MSFYNWSLSGPRVFLPLTLLNGAYVMNMAWTIEDDNWCDVLCRSVKSRVYNEQFFPFLLSFYDKCLIILFWWLETFPHLIQKWWALSSEQHDHFGPFFEPHILCAVPGIRIAILLSSLSCMSSAMATKQGDYQMSRKTTEMDQQFTFKPPVHFHSNTCAIWLYVSI